MNHAALATQEFLFAPFSVFTVTRVEWSPTPDDDTPHCIFLEAAVDNRKVKQAGLPLAPWS